MILICVKGLSTNSGEQVDVFVTPDSIESIRSATPSDDRSCVIRMRSGDEFRCGHTAEEFVEGLKRTLDEMMGHNPCRS
jgi:hypothetical protein